MVGYRVGGASSMWMSFIKYTIVTAAQKLLTSLVFPISLTRACCVKSQLHRLKLHVPIDGPSSRATKLEPHSWRGKLEPQLRDISHWKTERLARLSVIPKLTNVGV